MGCHPRRDHPVTRAALLLALLLPACGTARAFKQATERLGDAAIALKADAESRTRATETLAPPVAHLVETVDAVAHRTDDVLRWLLYFIVPGAAGGLFSVGKTAWRWVSGKRKRAAPRHPPPKP